MLIEGSSGSSGGLVGEHQPDELMRDGGRWVGRPLAVMSEMAHPNVPSSALRALLDPLGDGNDSAPSTHRPCTRCRPLASPGLGAAHDTT